jgi:hypothetical protein
MLTGTECLRDVLLEFMAEPGQDVHKTHCRFCATVICYASGDLPAEVHERVFASRQAVGAAAD